MCESSGVNHRHPKAPGSSRRAEGVVCGGAEPAGGCRSAGGLWGGLGAVLGVLHPQCPQKGAAAQEQSGQSHREGTGCCLKYDQ